MNQRAKFVCMALAAIFAFSAIASSAQAADQWYKSTTQTGTFTTIPVGDNEALSGTSGVSTLAVPALGFTIECKKDTFTGAIQNVATPMTVEAHLSATVAFAECQIQNVSTKVCQVKSTGSGMTSGNIKTFELTGSVNTSTAANKGHALFSPKSGTVFTEIEILGEECAFLQAKAVQVTGAVEGSLSPEGNVAAQKAVLTFPSPALAGSTLKYGTNPAKFVSVETGELTSKEWIMLK